VFSGLFLSNVLRRGLSGFVRGIIGGNGPLIELKTDAVGTDLDDDHIVLDVANGSDDTADGGDVIADLDAAAHCILLLLFLVLRTDHEEIESNDENDSHNDHGGGALAAGGSGCF